MPTLATDHLGRSVNNVDRFTSQNSHFSYVAPFAGSAVKKSVVNLAPVVASRIFADGTALCVGDLFFSQGQFKP